MTTQNGTIAWQFYTTSDDASSGPGIAVWATPAIDTGRKLVYIGTGNNYAAPTGPYADSMLAIDYETGQLVWSHQFTAEDVFVVGPGATGPDFDVGSTATLFTANGRDLVGIGVKNGIYYALDRDTGAPVWMQMVTPGSVLGGVISASAYANGSVFMVAILAFFALSPLVLRGCLGWRPRRCRPRWRGERQGPRLLRFFRRRASSRSVAVGAPLPSNRVWICC